jgi:hypothetical protein
VIAHRTYRITVKELKQLLRFAETFMEDIGCQKDGTDLCPDCQANQDLIQKLIDSTSLADVGCDITFTTYTGETEEAIKGTVQ